MSIPMDIVAAGDVMDVSMLSLEEEEELWNGEGDRRNRCIDFPPQQLKSSRQEAPSRRLLTGQKSVNDRWHNSDATTQSSPRCPPRCRPGIATRSRTTISISSGSKLPTLSVRNHKETNPHRDNLPPQFPARSEKKVKPSFLE